MPRTIERPHPPTLGRRPLPADKARGMIRRMTTPDDHFAEHDRIHREALRAAGIEPDPMQQPEPHANRPSAYDMTPGATADHHIAQASLHARRASRLADLSWVAASIAGWAMIAAASLFLVAIAWFLVTVIAGR